MASLNMVQLIGNLGADPEAPSMQNGGEVVSFRLACTESWKDKQGNRQERTEWHRVVVFNENIAKVAKQYLRKGSKVYVSGKLQTRKWQAQDGSDRYSTEVVLQPYDGKLILLDGKRDDQGSRNGGGGAYPEPVESDLDDDVPFATNDPALEHRVC